MAVVVRGGEFLDRGPGSVVGDHGGQFLGAQLSDTPSREPARWLLGRGVPWWQLGDESVEVVGYELRTEAGYVTRFRVAHQIRRITTLDRVHAFGKQFELSTKKAASRCGGGLLVCSGRGGCGDLGRRRIVPALAVALVDVLQGSERLAEFDLDVPRVVDVDAGEQPRSASKSPNGWPP